MGQFANDLAGISRALVRREIPSQSSLFSGLNPSKYDPSNPMPLWVIQVVLIIAFTQLLNLILGRIRQPRVIAETISGVLLGPTVLGRIPGFTAAIFPEASIPLLSLTSTIGLVIFVFHVGLEIDVQIVKGKIKTSIAISAVGLLVPLGLGAALGVGIYRQFVHPSVNFGYFVLFSAVAVGITAFPVLCRILIETKLQGTTVGGVTLSAGLGNDIVGWILLALAVALVNAGNGITALYVLLTSVGFVLFMIYPVQYVYGRLVTWTGCEKEPSKTMMTLTLLMVFVAAFFTDIIGVHPLFGGFLAGFIIPREKGYAIAVWDKLEDLVSIIFLPLFFTLSGLQTNLELLNNGVTWGWTFLLCIVSFLAKFVPCFIAAKLSREFNLRESAAIGALMSCKGLVGLIVLNVGLQARIFDTRTFSMFILHAIILTFTTTPITLLVYPPKYRTLSGITGDRLDDEATPAQSMTSVGTAVTSNRGPVADSPPTS
ncbi:hypothetical protein PILCRDRAFT_825111 [Piloderma croceum F 1598]|uniref:Cation/H+ exchanger transmembrane domain-containing protein n=1 Tax=Piloderma croceum (strain F 1598) TaxID=765440 RepID=A0A0C3FD86_PILCF|nr:hypothetical protein PILCRDRAFT_825111 [Piloderma croceum F 1598]